MKVAIFCGSSTRNNPSYINEAKKIREFFGMNGIELVYGSIKVGLMGTIANAVLDNGGNVFGIISEYLKEK